MLRNREIKIFFAVSTSVCAVLSVICFFTSVIAGLAMSIASLLVLIMFWFFTKERYKKIDELSAYLKEVSNGRGFLDIRDNNEGELSILKNEIYKVTMMLSEQAEQLKNDKIYLADSISDISHQLKTPLTSMLVMADLLCNDNLPADKRIQFTLNIKSQLERLQWLVSSLLKLSKMDAGTICFKKEKLYLKDIINKAVQPLTIPADIKNISISVTGDDNSMIVTDMNWTTEAIVNILKNCIEHTGENGSITVSFSENSLYSEILITDNGEGISPEDLPYIFKRFYKGRNASDDSVGIGLAMAHSIVSHQEGNITVSSVKDKGTNFTLRFYKTIV